MGYAEMFEKGKAGFTCIQSAILIDQSLRLVTGISAKTTVCVFLNSFYEFIYIESHIDYAL
jgi:hypothetical protein